MKYKIKITVTEEYYKEYEREADSEEEAKEIGINLLDQFPIDLEKNTYMGSDTDIEVEKL